MNRVLYLTLICAAIALQGCIQHSSVEQRVVELPDGNPNTSLATAAQIGNGLIASGLGAAIQKQFPTLTQQQLQGLYLTWNSGNFQGKQSVFFLTGKARRNSGQCGMSLHLLNNAPPKLW